MLKGEVPGERDFDSCAVARGCTKNIEQNSGPGLDSGGEPVGAVSGRNPKKTVRGSTPKQPDKQLCFHCGKAGHYAKDQKAQPKERSVTFVPKQDIFVLFVEI